MFENEEIKTAVNISTAILQLYCKKKKFTKFTNKKKIYKIINLQMLFIITIILFFLNTLFFIVKYYCIL